MQSQLAVMSGPDFAARLMHKVSYMGLAATQGPHNRPAKSVSDSCVKDSISAVSSHTSLAVSAPAACPYPHKCTLKVQRLRLPIG